jgi:bifunctional ADP-heptose synthase (sugar kinase/adenylyltransferase)/energy-coupling factor transporter ATP-binding protein EcfA2
MSDKATNIFVIGDLVIDHTVFVRDAATAHKGIEGEDVYEVVRRMDTAGGAANCARILAVLSSGRTFLWGLIGRSHWGNFRTILEKCHAVDEADSNVEFRGVQDETQAQMNTITRLVMIGDKSLNYVTPSYKVRFDDYGHLHVAEDKRQAVIHYLDRAHSKYTIDGIIINDLDMNGITSDMIKKIADFADAQTPPIPLFIDPKRERKKYIDIKGTAILPNLTEWCQLVGLHEPDAEKYWRSRLKRSDALAEMAQRSFRYLGNFRYHIITCDVDGSVLIAPHPKQSDRYAVYWFPPHNSARQPQLGCGDVLTAAFALEYSGSDQTAKAALQAFQKANATVGCYCEMSWHRMPNRLDVENECRRLSKLPAPLATPSKGMLYLPKEESVELSTVETDVPGLVSFDATFRSRVEELLKDISKDWGPKLKSIILGSPAGCGKSTIMKALKESLGTTYGIDVFDFADLASSKAGAIEWDNLQDYFKGLQAKIEAKKGRLLIMMDEALKAPKGGRLKKYGVDMLNAAHANNIRFLFIDAGFEPETKLQVTSEFTSRCTPHYLTGLAERPIDIPYIIASRVFEFKAKKDFNSVKIEGGFLLAITNATLSNPNPRALCGWVDKACASADDEWSGKGPFKLQSKHLSKSIRPAGKQLSDAADTDYQFYRAR